MEQGKLKKWLEKLLRAKYKEVFNEDGFLYAKGEGGAPILLTAHMDTVHKDKCREIQVKKTKEETILWSPQGIGGDDRCGIWLIWMVLTKTKYRPSILFCEDEEIGGVGSNKFVDTDYANDLMELKYLVELDRANSNDAVYYDCGNEEFKEYIEKTIGYKESYGSFSDIGHLSPACDRASVNLSCGYYRQHTLEEYVIFEEMFATFKAVKKLLADSKECETYDYQEESYYKRWNSNVYSFSDYYGDGWNGYDYSGYTFKSEEDEEVFASAFEIVFNNEEGKEDFYYTEAVSLEEAFGKFFFEHTTLSMQNVVEYYEY